MAGLPGLRTEGSPGKDGRVEESNNPCGIVWGKEGEGGKEGGGKEGEEWKVVCSNGWMRTW